MTGSLNRQEKKKKRGGFQSIKFQFKEPNQAATSLFVAVAEQPAEGEKKY